MEKVNGKPSKEKCGRMRPEFSRLFRVRHTIRAVCQRLKDHEGPHRAQSKEWADGDELSSARTDK